MKNTVKSENQFTNGLSLPRDLAVKEEVEFEIFLPSWFYVAVRKSDDILTKVFLQSDFDLWEYEENGSPVDVYVDFIFDEYDLFGASFQARFEDYVTCNNGILGFSYEKLYRKFARGDFDRILKPFDWVFDFMSRVSPRFDFPDNSIAQMIRHSLWNRGSHISFNPQGDDLVAVAKYLIGSTYDCLVGASVKDSAVVSKDTLKWKFRLMLLELFTTTVDIERSKEAIQCLKRD